MHIWKARKESGAGIDQVVVGAWCCNDTKVNKSRTHQRKLRCLRLQVVARRRGSARLASLQLEGDVGSNRGLLIEVGGQCSNARLASLVQEYPSTFSFLVGLIYIYIYKYLNLCVHVYYI